MALLGNSALAIWHDIAEGGEADFHEWHSREHLVERVGLPGFNRGRRCVAVDAAPRFFILYEVDNLAVLTSPPYLARLDDPTPWSARSVANFRDTNRSLCAVRHSIGNGVGSAMLALDMGAVPELSADALARLAAAPGITGAHLLAGDRAASATETAEKRLRARPDQISDRVLLIEGHDEGAVALAREACGAPASATGGLYRLQHVLDANELDA
jgi:hypothetical protein